jgi:hypothetical protein
MKTASAFIACAAALAFIVWTAASTFVALQPVLQLLAP